MHKLFTQSPGTIVELIGHDTRHCGVVLDEHSCVELIARRNDKLRKMLCSIILIDLRTCETHPASQKKPMYRTWKHIVGMSWTKQKLLERVYRLMPQYEESEYHVIYNNCQHFAWDLTTKKRKSPDADGWWLAGGIIGKFFEIKDFGSTGSESSTGSASISELHNDLLISLREARIS